MIRRSASALSSPRQAASCLAWRLAVGLGPMVRSHRVLEVGLALLRQLDAAVAGRVGVVARAEVDALARGGLVGAGRAAEGSVVGLVGLLVAGHDAVARALRPLALLLQLLLVRRRAAAL